VSTNSFCEAHPQIGWSSPPRPGVSPVYGGGIEILSAAVRAAFRVQRDDR